MKAHGDVFKFGDNVDTDVIIPARYLNSSEPKELAAHCMEDIDKDFVKKVKKGDLIVANKNFGDQGCWGKLCDRGDFRTYFLPECDQYRTADH